MSINDLSPRDFDRLSRIDREREALTPIMSKRKEIEKYNERKQLAAECGVSLEELAAMSKELV